MFWHNLFCVLTCIDFRHHIWDDLYVGFIYVLDTILDDMIDLPLKFHVNLFQMHFGCRKDGSLICHFLSQLVILTLTKQLSVIIYLWTCDIALLDYMVIGVPCP